MNFIIKHPVGTAIGVAVAFLASIAAVSDWLGIPRPYEWFDSSASKSSTGSPQEKKSAPQVVFGSGERCQVSFSVSFRLPEENVLAIFEHYVTPESAEADLNTRTVASVLSVMEKANLADVRKDRSTFEVKIVDQVQQKIFSPGYIIEDLSLLEIEC